MREMKASRLILTSGAKVEYSICGHQLQMRNDLQAMSGIDVDRSNKNLQKIDVTHGEQKDKRNPIPTIIDGK